VRHPQADHLDEIRPLALEAGTRRRVERGIRVAELSAKGLDYKEIADRLGVTPRTVSRDLADIRRAVEDEAELEGSFASWCRRLRSGSSGTGFPK
jgi:IS30 family transposase